MHKTAQHKNSEVTSINPTWMQVRAQEENNILSWFFGQQKYMKTNVTSCFSSMIMEQLTQNVSCSFIACRSETILALHSFHYLGKNYLQSSKQLLLTNLFVLIPCQLLYGEIVAKWKLNQYKVRWRVTNSTVVYKRFIVGRSFLLDLQIMYWLTQKRQDQVLYKDQVCQDVQSSSYFIQSN